MNTNINRKLKALFKELHHLPEPNPSFKTNSNGIYNYSNSSTRFSDFSKSILSFPQKEQLVLKYVYPQFKSTNNVNSFGFKTTKYSHRFNNKFNINSNIESVLNDTAQMGRLGRSLVGIKNTLKNNEVNLLLNLLNKHPNFKFSKTIILNNSYKRKKNNLFSRITQRLKRTINSNIPIKEKLILITLTLDNIRPLNFTSFNNYKPSSFIKQGDYKKNKSPYMKHSAADALKAKGIDTLKFILVHFKLEKPINIDTAKAQVTTLQAKFDNINKAMSEYYTNLDFNRKTIVKGPTTTLTNNQLKILNEKRIKHNEAKRQDKDNIDDDIKNYNTLVVQYKNYLKENLILSTN